MHDNQTCVAERHDADEIAKDFGTYRLLMKSAAAAAIFSLIAMVMSFQIM